MERAQTRKSGNLQIGSCHGNFRQVGYAKKKKKAKANHNIFLFFYKSNNAEVIDGLIQNHYMKEGK